MSKRSLQAQTPEVVAENALIAAALKVLEKRARYNAVELSSPTAVKDYLRLRMAGLEHEVFAVVFLDSQHRVIATEEMFRGTISQTSVYPREVVKAALRHNASAVILAHNHPSGMHEPSRADEFVTQSMKSALQLIDIRVLDHIVVSVTGSTSFAERGLL